MDRYNETKKVGLLGIIGNIFLLCIKLSVTFISKSQALFADAINSAGDIFSSIMTYLGSKIASIPSDEDHNFGHGKAEYIFSMLISIFMIFVACKVFCESILAIYKGTNFTFSIFLIIVCIATIITKLCLYIYAKNIYKKSENILVKASMEDHRNDIFLTTGTLISVIFSYFGASYIDSIFGALLSIYILINGIKIFLESYKVLMDISLSKDEKEVIINRIKENNKVTNVTDFYTISVGYKYVAILTIEIDGNTSTYESHEIANSLEKLITLEYSKVAKAIIHVNPSKEQEL